MFRRLDLLTGILIAACVLTTWLVDIPDAAVTQANWWQGEFWRIVPSILLHGDGRHLAVNCLSLFFVGTVVARGLGRPVYLAAVLLGAFAGFAASLLAADAAVPPDTQYRVGISGAIAGLVGLILAVEWRNSRGIGDFLRQRNTILIMIFVALSVGLSIYVERKNPGIEVDHAAHIGGAVACLVVGLVYYAKRREHAARGVAAVLLLGIVPLAYAAYPFRNVDFCVWKAKRAAAEEAGVWWERAYGLDPENPRAAAGTARMHNDPAPLETIRTPQGPLETYPVVEAYLQLAEARLESEPEVAAELTRKATRFRPAPHAAWAHLAAAAGRAGRPDLHYTALRMALGLARGARVDRATLRTYAMGMLPALEQELISAARGESDDRLAVALEAVDTIELVAPRLLDPGLDQRTAVAIEQMLVRLLGRVGILERESSLEGDPARLQTLRARLWKTWEALADSLEGAARGANYLYRSAYWWELAVEGTEREARDREAIANRVERALREARSYGAPETEKLAAQWFRDRKLPVPAGDLAGAEDGG